MTHVKALNVNIKNNNSINEIKLENVNQIKLGLSNIGNENAQTETIELAASNNLENEKPKLYLPNNNWIFGRDALKTHQFGGDQGELIDNKDYWLNDERTLKIIRNYYPDATLEEIEALFQLMNDVGCAYMAVVNSIFYEFIIHDESEFQEIFGFRPYELVPDENNHLIKDYNYEYLFLDFFLWTAKNTPYYYMNKGRFEGCETMQDVLEIMDGTLFTDNLYSIILNYLDSKGIKVNIIDGEYMTEEEARKNCEEKHIEYIPDSPVNKKILTSEIIEKYQEMGMDYVIIIGAGENTKDEKGVLSAKFDLYYPYDKDGNGKLDDIYLTYENGAHAITIVGTTSDPNKVIVSSWGEEYLVDISQVGTNYYILDYSEFNENRTN